MIHICNPEKCPYCEIMSCFCQWKDEYYKNKIYKHCPYCNGIIQEIIITESYTFGGTMNIILNKDD